MARDADAPGRRPTDSVGYLLAKIGAVTARGFAARLAPLDLVPAHAALLRVAPLMPGASQQHLAEALGVPPSRMVALIDDLEQRELVERRRSPEDRRAYAIVLTDAGAALGRRLAAIGVEHEREITRSLSEDERARLLALLQRIAQDVDLTEPWGEPAAPPRGRPPQTGRGSGRRGPGRGRAPG